MNTAPGPRRAEQPDTAAIARFLLWCAGRNIVLCRRSGHVFTEITLAEAEDIAVQIAEGSVR